MKGQTPAPLPTQFNPSGMGTKSLEEATDAVFPGR